MTIAYRTAYSPQELAPKIEALGFKYLETSCSCTTYIRGLDLMSVEEPELGLFEEIEIATDFRLSDFEKKALGIK